MLMLSIMKQEDLPQIIFIEETSQISPGSEEVCCNVGESGIKLVL